MILVRTRLPALVLALVTTVLAGGCSLRAGQYQYVRSPATGTYLKLPEQWKVAKPPVEGDLQFVRIFDAAARPKEDVRLSGPYPGGFVRVRKLSEAERDVISFAATRRELGIDLDSGIESGEIKVRDVADLAPEGGFRGQRVEFDVLDPDGGATITISQTTIVDRRTTRVYFLVLGCEQQCFEHNKKQIRTVVDSLTVKET